MTTPIASDVMLGPSLSLAVPTAALNDFRNPTRRRCVLRSAITAYAGRVPAAALLRHESRDAGSRLDERARQTETPGRRGDVADAVTAQDVERHRR